MSKGGLVPKEEDVSREHRVSGGVEFQIPNSRCSATPEWLSTTSGGRRGVPRGRPVRPRRIAQRRATSRTVSNNRVC
eukprot:1255061-Prymnesium_polylepis.1